MLQIEWLILHISYLVFFVMGKWIHTTIFSSIASTPKRSGLLCLQDVRFFTPTAPGMDGLTG